MAFIIVLIAIVVICLFLAAVEKYGKNKYGEEEWRRQVSDANKQLQHGKGYGIKCPNCGHIHVNEITTLERSVSVGVKGLASGKIGKNYECPNCKYIW